MFFISGTFTASGNTSYLLRYLNKETDNDDFLNDDDNALATNATSEDEDHGVSNMLNSDHYNDKIFF